MNCHEAYLWMLEAEEPAASPPAAFVEHLRDCRKCRRRQKRVLHLLSAVHELPPPPDNPGARAAVLATIRRQANAADTIQMPQPQPARKQPGPRRWLWRLAPVAAAALLVIGLLGWFVASMLKPENQTNPIHNVAAIWNDGDLRTRLLERNLRLAEARAVIEQLDALSGMATDLRRESLQQAGRVDNADLSRLAVLYERVIREGVLPRARALAADEQKERVPALVAELRETERDAIETAEKKPAAAEPLRRLARTAGDASHVLENPRLELPTRPSKVPEPPAFLVETLVVQGLKLADEPDPLKRADVCTDVADSLMRTIMEASQAGKDRKEMEKLGSYFGAVMVRAVFRNLDRVEVSQSDKKRQAEYRRVRQRADDTMQGLKQKLEEAPPPTREAIQQAYEASQYVTLDSTPPKK
jgi:hypothetical protein